MTAINESQIKILEQTRQRLLHLTHSLDSLTGSLHHSDPLPSWSSLQSQASIISNNLINICSQLAEHQELLSSLVAYPAPSFPGNTQQGVLEQLLRTKLDPRVEDWVTRGRLAATETSGGGSGNNGESGVGGAGLSETDLAELWSWAPIEANAEARRRNWGGNYTLEEKEAGIQNVVTGLRRALPDDDDEDEDEDEDEDQDEEFEDVDGDGGEKMEIVGVHTRPGAGGVEFDIARGREHVLSAAASPAIPLDEVFRYMMTGARPKSGA
ncbi:Mediator of RNA polymerase II transcription subunit 8 [Talaromyces pinophilus]|nr:Mediator of RNA polymerase II transcription subunit 8 [Talaromyces pinophilus]